jgi:tetratricopeptide (TPR) repeat protein
MLAHRRRASLKLAILAATVLAASLAIPAQAQDTFNDALTRGVTAFKAGHYTEAVAAFQKALAVDPKSTRALIDLGCAYAYQVVPNLDTPDNLALANKAIDSFKQVPADDPEYHTALKQIAALYRNTKRLDEARDTELAALNLNPDDAETHYTIGVIDWMEAYKFAVEALGSQGLTDDGEGNKRMTAATCAKIRSQNGSLVDDAITHLIRAVDLNPDYADAMRYLNLAYRRKADFDCADPTARTQDILAADKWIQRAVAVARAASDAPFHSN